MSLTIQEQVSLRPYNTLAVDVRARYFVAVQSLEQLQAALAWAEQRSITVLLLGGGSNLVLANDLDMLVIHLQLRGLSCSVRMLTLPVLKCRRERTGMLLCSGALLKVSVV